MDGASPPSPPVSLQRFRVTLALSRPWRPPPMIGSMLRGLIGHGLLRLQCVMEHQACDRCPLVDRCVYSRLFDAGRLGGSGGSPVLPWLLDLPGGFGGAGKGPTSNLCFNLVTLDGKRDTVRWLIKALEVSGRQRGIGTGRISYEIHRIEREEAPGSGVWRHVGLGRLPDFPSETVPPDFSGGKILLRIETPLRFKYRGKLLGPKQFHLGILLTMLVQRARGLDHWLGTSIGAWAPPLDSPESFIPMARGDFRWVDVERISSRQRRRMRLGGVMGRLLIDTASIDSWWPLLWLGQWFHIGKQTSMGLGQYRLVTASGTADSADG